jgi:hypothetical protein
MTLTRIIIAALIAINLAGCFGPEDRRPGMRLPGEVTPTPSDWSFTNDYPEIAIEVRTPYFLPHSVTIASGTFDGNLYVGARDPETKHWPGWVDADPEVRLGIGDRVYEVTVVPITDPAVIARILHGGSTRSGQSPPPDDLVIRFWQVQPRS